jgi:glycerophosphoryl diester phosphodiesterase
MSKLSQCISLIICCSFGPFALAVDRPAPRIVAHRGLLRHAPENTLANFRACLELRIGFEFDVQRTKDGQLVCIHDDTLDRTTNGSGKVSEKTLAEIQRLDAGRWFAPEFTGERVPTVEEVLKLVAEYKQHEILVAVDLKAEGVERDVVRLAEEHHILHRLLFIGRTISEPQVRAAIKQVSKHAQTTALANNSEEFPQAIETADADWVYLRFLPSLEQMRAVHHAGKIAFIAGVTVSGDVPQNWQQAAEAGMDGILTDYPLTLRAALRKSAGNN